MTYPNALGLFPADGEHDHNPGRRTATSNSADGSKALESDKSVQYHWCLTRGRISQSSFNRQSPKQVLPARCSGLRNQESSRVSRQQMRSPVKAPSLIKLLTHLCAGGGRLQPLLPFLLSQTLPFATSPSPDPLPFRPVRSPRPRGVACNHRRSGRAPPKTPYRQRCP